MDKARNKYEFPSSLLIRGKEEVRVLLGIEEDEEGEGGDVGGEGGERKVGGSRRGSAMSLVKGEPGGAEREKVVIVKELAVEQKGEGEKEKEKKEKGEE